MKNAETGRTQRWRWEGTRVQKQQHAGNATGGQKPRRGLQDVCGCELSIRHTSTTSNDPTTATLKIWATPRDPLSQESWVAPGDTRMVCVWDETPRGQVTAASRARVRGPALAPARSLSSFTRTAQPPFLPKGTKAQLCRGLFGSEETKKPPPSSKSFGTEDVLQSLCAFPGSTTALGMNKYWWAQKT